MARRASDGQEQYQRPGAAGSVLETCGRDRVGTSRELAVAVLPRDPRFPPRERGTGERRDAGRGNSSACRIAAGRRPKIALALRRVAGNWTTKSRSTNRASAAGTARCSRPWTSSRLGCDACCRWSEPHGQRDRAEQSSARSGCPNELQSGRSWLQSWRSRRKCLVLADH